MNQEPTKPSIARVYDYMLGGTHNYAIDREIGDRFAQRLPTMAQSMRLNRLFLENVIEDLAAAGLTCYIDLATGLPTEGNVHELLPSTARIVYNDIDPEVVAYAREIIGDQPNIHYVQNDLRQIDAILAVAEELFGAERRVGISMVGVAYFIEDAALAQVFQRLHDWCAPGSLLAITTFAADENDPAYREMAHVYEQQMMKVYPRDPEAIQQLASGWEPYAGGLQNVEEYAEQKLQTTLALNMDRGQLGFAGVLQRV